MSDVNDPDDDDRGRILPGASPEEVFRGVEHWTRGDALVTLWLVGLAESKARNDKSARETSDQLKQLIADEPDPTDLIHKLVLHIAMTVTNAAHEAQLEPLQYWQQQQLDQAGRLGRSADFMANFRSEDIPDDILEEEERHLREGLEQREADKDLPDDILQAEALRRLEELLDQPQADDEDPEA